MEMEPCQTDSSSDGENIGDIREHPDWLGRKAQIWLSLPEASRRLRRPDEVILFNNAGVSSSSGDVPTTFEQMGANAVAPSCETWRSSCG